jgi:hypothetical protein
MEALRHRLGLGADGYCGSGVVIHSPLGERVLLWPIQSRPKC